MQTWGSNQLVQWLKHHGTLPRSTTPLPPLPLQVGFLYTFFFSCLWSKCRAEWDFDPQHLNHVHRHLTLWAITLIVFCHNACIITKHWKYFHRIQTWVQIRLNWPWKRKKINLQWNMQCSMMVIVEWTVYWCHDVCTVALAGSNPETLAQSVF